MEKDLSFSEKVKISEIALEQFADFTKQHNCYTICPVFTSSEGRIYNSAVVFNRNGKKKLVSTIKFMKQ
jgi:predicted amidohydrolase